MTALAKVRESASSAARKSLDVQIAFSIGDAAFAQSKDCAKDETLTLALASAPAMLIANDRRHACAFKCMMPGTRFPHPSLARRLIARNRRDALTFWRRMTARSHPIRRDYSIRREHLSPAMFPPVVVAIPAQNEEQNIAACFRAIAMQERSSGAKLLGRIGVICFVNGTQDATYAVACAEAERFGLPSRILDAQMAPHAAHAGGARRATMDCAADWLEEGGHTAGLLFTTDADSVPASDWVVAARRAFSRGVHGVAGPIDLHSEDEVTLPPHVRARGALEAQYDALITEMFARLDPRPHDPWPCHATEAGANLAVTLAAYRLIGGLPHCVCGEDRALCAAIEAHGLRVRHDLAPRVSTSGRLIGRAQGGVADTLRLRSEEPDAVCDPYLEPAWNARFRALWRGRSRAAFDKARGLPRAGVIGTPDMQRKTGASFHDLWSAIETSDPRLARKFLRPADLPEQIAIAEAIVRRLRPKRSGLQSGRGGNPQFVPAE